MYLELHNLLPTYFESVRKNNSEIWGKEITLSAGDLVKIVAPSGSGKTSLIHFIYGIRNDYQGKILFKDADIRKYNREDFAKYRNKNISIVFQDLKLFYDHTVLENLEIKRQLNPYHPKEKITEFAQRLGIEEKLHFKAGTCSYGEQQRVAIIRSLLQPFDLLLLDEPFSHLDNNNALKAMELMLEESKVRNASMVLADLERIDFFPYTRLFHL
jgi:putative ABC transport system ATP-binding protein